MGEFRWIQMFLCLMIQIAVSSTVSVNETSIFMKAGGDVTLPCLNVIDEQNKCDGTTWTFASTNKPTAVELITLGHIGEEAKTKSDRLSVTANCSLLIKKLTVEDVGLYSCQQYKVEETPSKHTRVHLSLVELSIITLTEHKNTDKVTLSCSVVRNGDCHHTVKWLITGQDVDKENKEIVTSQTDCFTNVSVPKSHFLHSSTDKILKCEVTDTKSGRVQVFSPQPSGEETVDPKTTTKMNRKSESDTTSGTTTITKSSPSITDLSLYITGAVGLVILLITAVFVIRWKKNKGNKTQMYENAGLSLKPTETQSAPQTIQDLVEPEVSYATISYTKNSNSKTRVHRDGEGDAVTYSTVKAPSSASTADPSNLYSTVNVAIT
ncbi:transforming acidic coiled-coil-containing protein 1 [Sarotherodon galilaeus]